MSALVPWLQTTPQHRERVVGVLAVTGMSVWLASNVLVAIAIVAILVLFLCAAGDVRERAARRQRASANLALRLDSGEVWREARRWADADNLEIPLAEVVHRAMQREDGVDPDEGKLCVGKEVYATAQTARRNQNLRPGQVGTVLEVNERGYVIVQFAGASANAYRPRYLLPPDGFVTTLEERFRIQHEADLAELQAKEEESKRIADEQASLRAATALQPNVLAALEAAGVTEYRNGQGMVVYRRTAQPAIMQRSYEQQMQDWYDKAHELDDQLVEIYALGEKQPIRVGWQT